MTEAWRYVSPKRKNEKNEKVEEPWQNGARTGLVHSMTGMTTVLNLGGLHKIRKIRKTENKNIEKYNKTPNFVFQKIDFSYMLKFTFPAPSTQ